MMFDVGRKCDNVYIGSIMCVAVRSTCYVCSKVCHMFLDHLYI